jgi:hypothetical protein
MCFRQCIIATSVILAILVAPAKASADWLFTPFIGTAFNGAFATGFDDSFEDDEFERRFTYGASLGHMGSGVFGFELDFSYSPNFFETIGGGDGDGFTFAADSNVTTLMANMVLGAPIGGQSGPGLRPYGVAGIGLLRTKLTGAGDFFDIGDVSNNDLGYNIGGGIVGFISDNIGIRGDVRYFRAFNGGEDEDAIDFSLSDFTYWRASLGLTFRFGGN